MGKSKRRHGKLNGVAYMRPATVPDDLHPVDMSGVTTACVSCQDGNAAPSLADLMNDESRRGPVIIFKYWLPTPADCAVCQQKEPYQVYDFEASGITTEKMFGIVAACELQCGRKIIDCPIDDQSRELLKMVYSNIRKTYKDVVVKRPKHTISQVNDIFFKLDKDPTLRGHEKITFKCENGSVSFCLAMAMFGFRV